MSIINSVNLFNYQIKCLNSVTGKIIYNDTLPSKIDIEQNDRETNTLLLKVEIRDFLKSHVYCSELKPITPDRYDTILISKL